MENPPWISACISYWKWRISSQSCLLGLNIQQASNSLESFEVCDFCMFEVGKYFVGNKWEPNKFKELFLGEVFARHTWGASHDVRGGNKFVGSKCDIFEELFMKGKNTSYCSLICCVWIVRDYNGFCWVLHWLKINQRSKQPMVSLLLSLMANNLRRIGRSRISMKTKNQW